MGSINACYCTYVQCESEPGISLFTKRQPLKSSGSCLLAEGCFEEQLYCICGYASYSRCGLYMYAVLNGTVICSSMLPVPMSSQPE